MRHEILRFEQIHIDIARNSTDDFNPFHDPRRWKNIAGNPFGSTIALGFQMAGLAMDRVDRLHQSNAERELIERHGLHFSNVELMFADALRPGEDFNVEVKKTKDKTASDGGLSNRVVIRKAERGLALIGTISQTAQARFLAGTSFDQLPSLEHLPDRALVPGSNYFLKRKFLNTSNGKNFCLGTLCRQNDYFDELAECVKFPPMFTSALLSCALLEHGWAAGHNFEADPLVYTSHLISIDRRVQQRLLSNDKLHILIEGPLPVETSKGLGKTDVEQFAYHCYGLVYQRDVLFRAQLQLAPLHAIISADSR